MVLSSTVLSSTKMNKITLQNTPPSIRKNVKTSSSVKLLGVHIDDELNFNLHITKVCRSAANQLHALIRLQMFLNFEEKKTLINSYFYSSFNYCPLVWMFSSAKSLNKVESLQKRALRFLYEDYVLSYEELLQKARKETMGLFSNSF